MTVHRQHALLVRHAHAEWPHFKGADFDRPLTPQGLADARATAAAIRDAGHRPGLLITSPALRTMQTTGVLAATLELPEQAVQSVNGLYNAGPEVLHEEVCKAWLHADVVMLVAHNPGISELARMLTGQPGFTALRPAQWLHFSKARD